MSPAAPPVCILLRYFTVGGLERVVIALANAFAARAVDTRVVVLSAGKRNALITELGAKVDVKILGGNISSKLTSLRALTENRIVHIHFGDGRIHPLVRCALLGRTVIVTYHSIYSHKRSYLRNRLDQFWASRAKRVIAVSNAVKDFCVSDVCIQREKIAVIANGVATRNGVVTNRPLSVPMTAISLAGLYPHKNQGVVLEALLLVRQDGLNLRLRIIGDGPMMAVHFQRCLELGLREHVDWYGSTWRRDIVEPLLASSDMFISASRFEGLPLSVLEGMSHGLPMVLSDIPSHREVAGQAALYFPADDASALAQRLSELCSNPQQHTTLRQASLERVRLFDLERCIDEHLAVYRGVASK